MTLLKKESSLLKPVSTYFFHKSFRRQEVELRFYDYRMDFYAFSKHINKTVAAELKLLNWRRAFQQSLIYQLCADFIFIAMPSSNIPKVDISLLSIHGIGLIAVTAGGRCRQILAPLQSLEVRSWYRDDYIKALQRRVAWP